MQKRIAILALVLLVLGSAGAANIWVGAGQPYSDIKTAITDASNGDIITVKDGTYTGANNTKLDFKGKTLILQSENGPQNCIIDCENSSYSTAFNFSMSGEGADAIVDGFTIINATNNAISINGGWDGGTCPTIKNCIIKNNSAYRGAGIICTDTTSLITGCNLSQNTATFGAAIDVGGSNDPRVENCVISNNTASESGGAIFCSTYRSPVIKNCLLAGNTATTQKGGAIFCDYGASPTITNCTIVGNSASYDGGGGIYCYSNSGYSTSPIITNTIFANNTNFAIYEGGSYADPEVTFCHFYNNSVADYKDHDTWQWTGAIDINMNIANASNNIDGNPLFVAGPLTDYYLSQIASGQAANSPCVNAGTDTASNLGLNDVTTRTDGVYDIGVVDIGYHHPDPPASLYELSASVSGDNGSVSPESGSYVADSVIDLTATPSDGYRVKQWSGTDDDNLKTTANKVTMDSNKIVAVEFEVIPSIIYVDDDGPGEPTEDGSSANPYDTIQEAVDIVPVDGTIIVLDGTYTGSGNNQINFNGKALTLKSENGPQSCIIDCQYGPQAFYLINYETNDSAIQGFTITNGYAFEGGAIYLDYASPTIKDCIFTNNQAYGSMTGGGAIHCSNASPLIDNCRFTKNHAYHFGGAIQIRAGSSPTITHSAFIENDVDDGGGAIYISVSSANIQNCRFTANDAIIAGGAIYSKESSYSVINCTINNNTTAGIGGGIYCYTSSPSIVNSIFTQNNKAIVEGNSDSDPNVTYCLFYNNPTGDYYDNDTSTSYTAAVNINTNVPQASNNIDGDPLYAADGYFDVNGTAENPDDDFWVDGDYHLNAQNGRWDPNAAQWIKDAATSPCIDAGSPNSYWKRELWPHGKRANIGLYGNSPHASMSDSEVGNASDFDNNEIIDGNDLSVLGQLWLNQNTSFSPADISRNGNIDMTDFAYFADGWQQPIE